MCARVEKFFRSHVSVSHNFPDIVNGDIRAACENSADTIPVIFPGASPSRGEIEYRTKVILGVGEKYNLNAARKRRVQTPYAKCPFVDPVALRNHSAPAPFATLPPSLAPLHRAVVPSSRGSTAHAYEIYKTTPRQCQNMASYIRGSRMRARKRSRRRLVRPRRGSRMRPPASTVDDSRR